MKLEATKTKENLMAALSGESMARNKYTYFAMAAKREGLQDVADAFDRMARNEMAHAQLWFKLLNGDCADTRENLRKAAQGELSEWHTMYPEFARQAKADGLDEIATMFERVAKIEREHEFQFLTMLAALGKKETQPTQEELPQKVELLQGYRCQFCGAVYEKEPSACETCQAIGAFEVCSYRK